MESGRKFFRCCSMSFFLSFVEGTFSSFAQKRRTGKNVEFIKLFRRSLFGNVTSIYGSSVSLDAKSDFYWKMNPKSDHKSWVFRLHYQLTFPSKTFHFQLFDILDCLLSKVSAESERRLILRVTKFLFFICKDNKRSSRMKKNSKLANIET